jgi:hypothetical protein
LGGTDSLEGISCSLWRSIHRATSTLENRAKLGRRFRGCDLVAKSDPRAQPCESQIVYFGGKLDLLRTLIKKRSFENNLESSPVVGIHIFV